MTNITRDATIQQVEQWKEKHAAESAARETVSSRTTDIISLTFLYLQECNKFEEEKNNLQTLNDHLQVQLSSTKQQLAKVSCVTIVTMYWVLP